MLRGLIAGGLTGVVVGGIGIAAASLMAELPPSNTPPAAPQTVTNQTDASPAPEEIVPQAMEEPVLSAPDTSAPATPQADAIDEGGAMIADTQSADVPDAAPVSDTLAAPETTQAPEITAAADAPVLPSPQSIAPQAPIAEQGVDLSTMTAPLPDPSPTEEAVAAPAPDVQATTPFMPDLVFVPDASTGNDIFLDDAPAPPDADDSAVLDDPDAELIEPPIFADDAPALLRFGTPTENPNNLPALSVVLLDDGTVIGGAEAVASIGFPVTVIIDPALPDAAQKAAEYRAAGIEVAVRTLLPDAPTAADVSVSLEASLALVPDAVALVDIGEGGLRNRQDPTQAAMARLSLDGRGFLSVSQGLNTSLRIAEQANVPAKRIFRDLDAEDQSEQVIRRFIDQAAFRARRDGEVVLLGRIRAETLTALVLWQSSSRASEVALLPLSALMYDPPVVPDDDASIDEEDAVDQ